jgi:hypothetical protein
LIDPARYNAWVLFYRDDNPEARLHKDIRYILSGAPARQKLLAVPGMSHILQLRGLERVECQFHPEISLQVLYNKERKEIKTLLRVELC